MTTMKKLKRYRGHFYNGYDRESLSALDPKLFLLVNSGNLAGHLNGLATAETGGARLPVKAGGRSAGSVAALTILRE